MGGKESCIQNFGRETLRERDHLRDQGVDVKKNMKMNLQEVG